MHLRFYAASAVVSAPASPQSAAQISLRIDRIVAGYCSVARRLPRLGILAWWDQGMGTSRGNRLVAFSRVIRAICGDAADVLIGRDLGQEFGQHGSITNVAAGDFDRSDFKRFLIDAYVYLTPDAAFGTTMLASVPLAFTFGLDACAVDKEVQRTSGTAIRQTHVQCWRVPQSVGQLNFGIDAGKDFGCHPLLKSIS